MDTNLPSTNVLFSSIKAILGTIRKQNPEFSRKIKDTLDLCNSAMENQKFAEISYALKDLSFDVDQNFDDTRDRVLQMCKSMNANLSNEQLSCLTAKQKALYNQLSMIDNKTYSFQDVLKNLSELTSDMAISISAYRNESFGDKTISDRGYSEGVDAILAADVASAGKRITRDLKMLGKQLEKSCPDQKDVASLISKIDSVSNGKTKFYESVDLLSEVTWSLYKIHEQSIIKEKSYLIDLSKQFSAMSKSCAQSLSNNDEARDLLTSFDDRFQQQLEQLEKSSRSSNNITELQNKISEHVEMMQQELANHILMQTVTIKKQEVLINEQNAAISTFEEEMEVLKKDLKEKDIESNIDNLTGLKNRRSYDNDIKAERSKYIQTGGTLAISLLDVDHFKKINDNYGHATGDKVLRLIGRILLAIEKKFTGINCYRYGGEEFAIIAKNISKNNFVSICKKVRKVLKSEAMLNIVNSEYTVTTSMGLACFSSKDDTHDHIFRLADKALYRAKSDGRDGMFVSNRTMMVKCD